MPRTFTRRLQAVLWAQGKPTSPVEAKKVADVYRAALKLGLTPSQAFELTKDAYNAAKGYEWLLAGGDEGEASVKNIFRQGCGLRRETVRAQAALHPRGKCAEDLAAALEGRASRWGTEAFHRGEVA